MRAGGRNDGLDLIRATGAFLVFATHLYHSYGQTWLGPIAAGGNVGIFLFFPLSGYLLYRPFVQGRADVRRYAIMRAARIFPAYYVAAAVIALTISPVVASVPVLTFTTNVFPTPHADNFGQSWTLGVELAFYALLPLLARARSGLTLALLAVVSFVFLQVTSGWWWQQLPTLFWAFGAGMLVARYQERLPNSRLWLLGAPLVLFGVVVVDAASVTLGGAALILASAKAKPVISWARFPADISYGVYLWHPFGVAVLLMAGLDGPSLVVASVLLVVAIASASWVLLERPILRWASHADQRDHELRAVVRARESVAGAIRPDAHLDVVGG